jgi:Flp pilus assembly CpaE family ATPase
VTALNIAVVSRDGATRAAIAEQFDLAPPTWRVALFEDRPSAADVVVRGPDVETPADVVFDPERPERLLDDIAGAAVRASKLVVVTGAGRGTGVTSVALHLARSLAASRETCLLELDPTSGTRYRLGLGTRATLTWADAGDTPDDLRLAAIPVAGGFRALLGSPVVEPPEGLIERLRTTFDRVVVDLPAGEPDRGALTSASAALLIVPPTPSGLARARIVLTEPAGRWALVLNRTGHGGEVRRADIAAQLERKVVLELPCTPMLRDAEDEGRLLRGPWTRYNRRIARLAAGLEAL